MKQAIGALPLKEGSTFEPHHQVPRAIDPPAFARTCVERMRHAVFEGTDDDDPAPMRSATLTKPGRPSRTG
jgi:hypothetical protein